VKLHIHSGDADTVMERLDKGLADIGLLIGSIKQEKYDYLNIHQNDVFGLLMPQDCELAQEKIIPIEMLKSLPLIFSEQTFLGHQNIDWFGINYHELNIVATYNLIYNATFLVEKGVGYALCLDRLVNTVGRNLTFRPINPELSLELYLVTKKYQTFSPAVKVFMEMIKANINV
jgi:transcriptional regulator